MHKLFVVNKPINISSNFYLRKIKKKYNTKKAGFSGTLDPFACGCLIVAFGKYAKLFRFLEKTPKTYRTTIWIGAISESLDNENVKILNTKKIIQDANKIKSELKNLIGKLTYLPPKYSAKKIDGQRAYKLARDKIEFDTKQITSHIFDINFLSYCHPFITFDITVSEGSYIRSIAQVLLDRLNLQGTLSYLERLNEGKFKFEDEKPLNPLEYLDIKHNNYIGDKIWFELGKKLNIDFFTIKDDGQYIIVFDTFFSIIKIENLEIKYILNKIQL
jgi:tRNA pseudouridine55 synthase